MGWSRDQGSKEKKEILQSPEASLIGKNPSLWSLPFSDKNEMKISCLFLP